MRQNSQSTGTSGQVYSCIASSAFLIYAVQPSAAPEQETKAKLQLDSCSRALAYSLSFWHPDSSCLHLNMSSPSMFLMTLWGLSRNLGSSEHFMGHLPLLDCSHLVRQVPQKHVSHTLHSLGSHIIPMHIRHLSSSLTSSYRVTLSLLNSAISADCC